MEILCEAVKSVTKVHTVKYCYHLLLHTFYSICATIEEQTINPTNEQAQTCLRIFQMLSNYYRDVQMFRFDDRTGEIYILAGEELQIIVPPNEPWRFINETEL